MRRVYVASSWRNNEQSYFVKELRKAGHEVYDFKHEGFSWSSCDPNYKSWGPVHYLHVLHSHPLAKEGFKRDMDALNWADTCLCVLPCGRSAHLELGYAIGQGKKTCVYISSDQFDPDLMYLAADFITDHPSSAIEWIDKL